MLAYQPDAEGRYRWAEAPEPELVPGAVRIHIEAAALNRADLLQVRGMYPPPPGASPALGLECAGYLDDGSRVMALLPGGGYAERVVVHRRLCMPMPESMSFEQAAALPEALCTAHSNLFAVGRLAAGESWLIGSAAGGIGSVAVQLAAAAGAHTIAVVGSEDKVPRVRELGAHACVLRTGDMAAQVRQAAPDGLHGILDTAGAPTVEQLLPLMSFGGRVVCIGLLGGTKATINMGAVLANNLTLAATTLRNQSVHHKAHIVESAARHCLPMLAAGTLRPVVHCVLPFSHVESAHALMASNAAVGKIVLSRTA